MPEVLLTERRDGVAMLTMNRPERRNAISDDLVRALLSELDRIAGDEEVGAVVLTGAGGTFSVGGDLEAGAGGGVDTGVPTEVVTQLRSAMRVSQLLHEMPQVTIAAIDGACAGAALSLATACDLRYCSERARFATAFVNAGVSGDFGGTWTLPRVVGPAKARELYLLSEKLGAEEAHAIGLVSRVFSAEELSGAVAAIAERIAAKAPLARRGIKANLNDSERLSFAEALDREAERHVRCSFSADAAEAAAAFLGKRPPVFHGR